MRDGLGGRRALPGSGMNPARDHLKAYGVPILVNPFDTPFGRTFVFQDPDRCPLAIHGGS